MRVFLKKIFILCLLFSFVPLLSFAQNSRPDVLMSWSSDVLTPYDHKGGTPPSPGSVVRVSIDIINNGKIIALDPYTVEWRVNGAVAGGGRGRSSFSFVFSDLPAPIQTKVEAKVLDYPGKTLFGSVVIKSVSPEVGLVPAGKDEDDSFLFRAVPFFFKARSLLDMNFSWSADGNEIENVENPYVLKLFPDSENINGRTFLSLEGFSVINPRIKASNSLFFSF